ncbi:hypothetical protein GCM10010365_71570 [Streptomyces poonensis]|uniref:Uncharacterized protein n=1 Tax=Streptomyces poonensis TaxID=68255 RepID=A0A918UXB1_9ACTN|nr:hypothetical protein GCM10010365_71570 [Streptomyces poonensis]
MGRGRPPPPPPRAAGFEIPCDEDGCSWIAGQRQPGGLALIVNLVRLDGAWQQPPAGLLRRISDEAHRIEQDLRLIPVSAAPRQPTAIPARADSVYAARGSPGAARRRAHRPTRSGAADSSTSGRPGIGRRAAHRTTITVGETSLCPWPTAS